MKITVTTPSCRPDFLNIVGKCLERQTFNKEDFHWMVGVPSHLFGESALIVQKYKVQSDVMNEPDKIIGDYYKLNACWNMLFSKSEGELIVNIVDGLWFAPNVLDKLWTIYEINPMACVSGVGHQYDRIENGKPEHMVWKDPRVKDDANSFYKVSPTEMELCIASLPRQAIYDVGGIDEEFDKYAALSEKEMCWRMARAGYEFYLNQAIEYRAIKHDRLSAEWDQRYFEGCKYFDKCLKEIQEGTRLRLDFLKE